MSDEPISGHRISNILGDLTAENWEYEASPVMDGDKFFELTAGNDVEKLGMKYNGVEITTIVEGKWAEQQKVEIDDEIVEVGGKPFAPMSRDQKRDCLTTRPLQLKFKRPVIKDVYYTLELKEAALGLAFKGARISSVNQGGWADRCGILVNDEIAEVDGVGFSTLEDKEKMNLFTRPRPISLKFKRPAKTRKQLHRINSVHASHLPGTAHPPAKPAHSADKPIETPAAATITEDKVVQKKSSKDAPAKETKGVTVNDTAEEYVIPNKEAMKKKAARPEGGICGSCCAPEKQVDSSQDFTVGLRVVDGVQVQSHF